MGKSTVAPELARALRGAVISIDDIPVVEAEWDGGSEELFLKANTRAAEEAGPLLAAGTSAIFDGCFYWPRVITDLALKLQRHVDVFTLEAPLEICVERDRRRTQSHGEEAARAVFDRVGSFEVGTRIDATQSVPVQIDAMLRTLGSNTRRA